MANLYEGEPDKRQAGDIEPTRFRPRYRKLTDNEVALHDDIKAWAEKMESLINTCGAPDMHGAARYRALAITSLEQTVMWAVKALTL